MSEDMSPYCSAHDEWLIMKLCIYFGYHDANNVSNFGGDPVSQLNLKKRFIVLFMLFYRAVTRSQFLRRLLRDHTQTAAVWKTEAARNHHRHHERGNKRPYQPKHSPSKTCAELLTTVAVNRT